MFIFRVTAPALLLAASCLGGSFSLWVDDDSGNIATVDVQSGQVTLVGNAGVVLTDIAFSPTGTLYGTDFSNLYTIDPVTGLATMVGSFGGPNAVNSMVFAPDGTLYVADYSNNTLYSVDPATGLATTIGDTGFSAAGDLVYVNGSLYLSSNDGQLVQVDTTTGAGTPIGGLGVVDMFGMASATSTSIYGVSGQNVYLIDPANGNSTFLSTWAGSGLGAAYGASGYSFAVNPQPPNPPSGDPTSVPEPSTFAFATLGAVVLVILRKWWVLKER